MPYVVHRRSYRQFAYALTWVDPQVRKVCFSPGQTVKANSLG